METAPMCQCILFSQLIGYTKIKNYLQMSNNNNNEYKLKYVACVEFYDKTIGIKKEV